MLNWRSTPTRPRWTAISDQAAAVGQLGIIDSGRDELERAAQKIAPELRIRHLFPLKSVKAAGVRLGPYKVLSAIGPAGWGRSIRRATRDSIGQSLARFLPDVLAADPQFDDLVVNQRRLHMRASIAWLLAGALSAAPALAQTRAAKPLEIYVIDVEGGNATLFVAPSGESLLMDTGNAGAAAARDAGRILQAVHDAGVTEIDHLIITHWHGDHFGGLAELSKQIPIKHYYDHGPNVQPGQAADDFLKNVYPDLIAKAQHTVLKAGDQIPLAGLEVRVVTSAGETIKTPLRGAGAPNPSCASFKPGENNAEDPMSVGIHITFGRFRTIHLGDVTKNKEFELMCPNNRIGTVDLLLGLHHGQSSSNSPVLVHALHPRAAIMNDGTRKGGEPETMQTVFSSPGLEDLWELHFSLLSGQEYTVPGAFIANETDQPQEAMPRAAWVPPPQGQQAPPAPVHNGQSYYIKVMAQQDGTFTVTNMRNHFSKTYRLVH
jgi:beta-lactamase superfamily II metal-dependent hydrolase